MPRILASTLCRRARVYTCGLAAGWAVWIAAEHRGQAGELEAPPLVRIEPDYGAVPANHLKFYLQFAGPMERGSVFQYLRLIEIDEKAKEIAEVPEPFREVELWDETFTRLTLWFHPGRQKPGVNLNVEIGPVLEEGKHYALEISGDWPTESGESLSEKPIFHRFFALPMDERQTDPAEWQIVGGGVMVCNDLLDPVSLSKFLRLETAQGEPVIGIKFHVSTGAGKYLGWLPKSISGKTPDALIDRFGKTQLTAPASLSPGRYRLVIDPKLEDLAGNSIARPFNLDLRKKPDFKERKDPVSIPFEIPPKD